jgi:3'-5' exoribonuclease
MSGCIRITVHHASMASARSEESSAHAVATLRDGDEVDAIFACTQKERRIARTGSPYLDIELRDATGSIRARAFRDADVLDGRFARGELVHVRGRVGRYRDELQVELDAIARARDADTAPERFLPLAYRDLDELEGFMEHLTREVFDPRLRGLLDSVAGDAELRAELRRAPCSIPAPAGRPAAAGVHHAYLGGLLEHTVAVGTLALETCTLHPRLDRDLLTCAALVHDLGRTREFTYGAEIARTEEGLLLGHVEIGLRLIREHAPASLSGARLLELEHSVLLHHGPEAAAGRRFRTAEAVALYRLNQLDTHLKGALETGAL